MFGSGPRTALLDAPAPAHGSGQGFAVRMEMERPLMKASAEVDRNGTRILYMEASNEVRDLQGEKVLLSALEASIPYFLKFGRLDLDHASVLGVIRGKRVDPYAYEIGKPLDCRIDGQSIWVKAAIYSSSTPGNRWTEAADLFWDSLHTNPPTPWFPSVEGDVYSEASSVEDGKPTQIVKGLRWNSIGLSRVPVNQALQAVSTMPIRAFAKAFASADDLKATLYSLGRGHSLAALPARKAGDPDVVAILRALSDTRTELGLDEFLAVTSSRGIPPEHAIATLLALLTP